MNTDFLHKPPARDNQTSSCLSRPLALLTLLLSVAVCASLAVAQDRSSSRWYGRWVEASPSEVGYDDDRLKAAIDEIGQLHGVQGLLLVRRGYLVAERYWRGGARDVPHNLKSASKSVMSALVGIAIERGHLGLDQPIAELLPEYDLAGDPVKKRITVRHLLTMTSGLQSTSYQAYNEWVNHPDWIRSVLAAPQVSEPGARYSYSTANTHLLSAILAGRTGQDTRSFAQRQLFDPMGIEVYDWMTDPDGVHVGGNNLWLMPRDLAKFGQLYLDQGRWGERQLIPADWVAASTHPVGGQVHETHGGYGYLWWAPNGDGSFAAVGYGGQCILVSPRDDTVVVVLSTLVSKGDYWEGALFGLLREGVGGSLVNPQLPAGAVARGDVELRSAPQAGGRALRRVSAGERLDLFGRDGDWLRVRGRGEEGWLRSDQVEVETPPGARQVAGLAPAPAAPGGSTTPLDDLLQRARALDRLAHAPPPLPRYRTNAMVNFRRSPNLVGELIGKVPPDIEFQALERSEAWLMAEIDGERGWLHSDFVQVIGPASPRAREQEVLAGIASLVDGIERLDRSGAVDRETSGDRNAQGQATAEAELGAVQRQRERELGDCRVEVERLQLALQETRAQQSEAAAGLNDALAENQTLQHTLGEVQQRLAALGDAKGVLEQALRQAWSAQAIAVTGLYDQRTRLEAQQAEIAALQRDKAEHEGRLQAGEARVAQLEQELGVAQTLARSLQTDIDGLREQAAGRESALAATAREKASALEPAATLETALERQQGETAGLKDLLAQAEASAAEARASVESAEVDVRIARAEAEAPTAPAPAAAAAQAVSADAPIEDFVRRWAAAWARQDVDGYLSHYAADFQPADGVSRAAWARLRRQHVLRPKRIDVEVSGFETARLEDLQARVTFEQAYHADHYQDRVSKTLVLRLEGDDWKILREDSRPLPAAATTSG